MAFKSYPFSSAMISFRHLSLLNKDNILTAAGSDTADSAMLALREKGYAKGAPELENPYEFESIVAYELKETIAFLKNVAPQEALLNLFLLKYDYLNAKTLLKLDLLGVEFSQKDISPFGAIPFEILKESIADQTYSRLPKEMADTMRHLDKAFAINEDATVIGLKMDKAYSQHVNRLLKTIDNVSIHEYFKAYFDFTNILVVLRLKAAGHNADVLQEALLDGGRFFAQELTKAFEDKSDGAVNYFYKYGYEKHLKEPFEKLISGGGLFAVEKARDDYLLDVIKKDKYDMFSSSGAVGFLLAKEREAAAVRLLMVAMLNNISADEIGRRLKELYI